MLDRERVKPFILSIFTFCLVFFPIYFYYERFRLGAAISFVAPDAFYYLDVARNSQGLGFFTFDGLHATNGFHPLWQYLLTYLGHFPAFSFSGRDPIGHIFLLDLLIVSIGYGFLAIFAAKQVRLTWLVPIALCPGLTWFIMSIADPNYLSAWSFVNGMESGLSILCFGIVFLFFGRTVPNGWRLYAGAFFLGLAVLSRLDDIFFLLAFFAYVIWRSPQHRLKAALPFGAPILMISAYLVYNRIKAGTYFPVSGAAKVSLAFGRNLLWTLTASLPRSWDLHLLPAVTSPDYSIWAQLAMRLFQLWFPILIGGVYLAVGYRRHSLHDRPVLYCLCAGTLAKGLYNLIFVGVWSQGSWYYPVSIFTCNVVLAVVLDELLEYRLHQHPQFGYPILRYAGIPSTIALFTWFCFFGLVAHKDTEQSGRTAYQTYTHGQQIANDIRNAGAPIYLELDDGLIAYATGMPGISALGLATDAEAVKAKQEGRYLDLMDRRGAHVIVASGIYISGMNRTLQAGANPGGLLGNIEPSEFARYSIESGPKDEDSDVAIYRIIRK